MARLDIFEREDAMQSYDAFGRPLRCGGLISHHADGLAQKGKSHTRKVHTEFDLLLLWLSTLTPPPLPPPPRLGPLS